MKVDNDFVIKTLTFYDSLNEEQQKMLLDNISSIIYKKGDLLLYIYIYNELYIYNICI